MLATTVFPGRLPFLSGAVRRNRLLILVVGLHALAAALVARFFGGGLQYELLEHLTILFTRFVPVFLLVLLLWHFLRLAIVVRPARPLQRFASDVAAVVFDAERLAAGLIAMLVLSVLTASAAFFKSLIPEILPFVWDPAFAALDRALHGGVDPWRLIMPLTGIPAVSAVINFAYHAWLGLLYFLVFVAAFSRGDGGAGRTFLLAYALCWLIAGNALATIFASAGPVYYEALGFGDTFAPLMAELRAIDEVAPVWALNVHDLLWQRYASGENFGISAFPSMHLASSTLFMLYGFRHSRWAGWALAVFLGLIMVGSVHLAWHYAIDGYAGILLAWFCWWLAGRLLTDERRRGEAAQ